MTYFWLCSVKSRMIVFFVNSRTSAICKKLRGAKAWFPASLHSFLSSAILSRDAIVWNLNTLSLRCPSGFSIGDDLISSTLFVMPAMLSWVSLVFSMSRVRSQSLVGVDEKGHREKVDAWVGKENAVAIVKIVINI